MKLEDQYNTPEQGKHLVELGIDPSLANVYYYKNGNELSLFFNGESTQPNATVYEHDVYFYDKYPDSIPAFSVSELIEMIYGRPDDAEITMAYNKSHEGWTATLNKRLTGFGKTQAEATAAALIFLLGGTYTAAECNERLKNA